jgi:putative endonuclease
MPTLRRHSNPFLSASMVKLIFYVYILYTEKFDKYYIGQTKDLDNRLELHNAGFVISTKPYLPWKLTLAIQKESRSEAMILEKKLKNLNRQKLLAFIEKYT